MATLETVIARIDYTLHDANDFIINIYTCIDDKDPHYENSFKGKGRSLNTLKNLTVKLKGYWSQYKGEEQFSIVEEEIFPIKTDKSFVAYVATKYDGIGTATANKILKAYGPNYEVLNDQAKLEAVLPPRYAKIIYEQSKKFKKTQDVFDLFAQADILGNKKRMSIAEKIDIETIYDNPFILQDKEFGGLSFLNINKLCLFKQNDPIFQKVFNTPQRVQEGVIYNLTDILFQRGHTWIDSKTLIQETIKFLNTGLSNPKLFVNENDIKEALNFLNREHRIKCEKKDNTLRVYNAFFYDCENYIAKESVLRSLNSITNVPIMKKMIPNNIIDSTIADLEKELNIKLADCQKLSVRTIINSKICVITGSAGTGKTTVLNAAIKSLQKLRGGEIVLAAPTGRAARRMAFSTGLEANTLHHLLGISNEGDSVIPIATKQIEADYVFIDEASMCDIAIIYKLFQQCSDDCSFIFIGDPNQLPSVGAGNVLDDFIQSNRIPVIKLKYIYRQAKDSKIVLNANRILNSSPVMMLGDDFEIYESTVSLEIQDIIVKKYQEELNRTKDLFETQIITPKRRDGDLSAYHLNLKIQSIINPHVVGKFDLIANGFNFREGDKVICCKNTKTVKNGDIGLVLSISKSGNNYSMLVEFDDYTEEFDSDQVKELNFMLAHAITVHKSQGSEFRSVLMPIATENRVMLKRNLFYTAITRAKEKMIIVGSKNEIKNAVANNKKYHRNTLLKQRIEKYFDDYNREKSH